MCGIAGIYQLNDADLLPATLQRMSQSLLHRGPDACGFLSWSPGQNVQCSDTLDALPAHRLSLMHRRLAIVDLSATGWQPMTSVDGRYHIVFNGEIYNFVELRDELKALGFQFASHSDTEVLMNAYAAWGSAALPKLVGMFAFALLDVQRRKLVLARDPFGIKPLYYASGAQTFSFASEIGTLLENASISRRANADSVYQYLHNGQSDHTSATFFEAIQQIPPAHYLEICLDNPEHVELRRYWSIDLNERLDISFSEAAAHLRDQFFENVELHLRSDVPVGAALSGGVDSSSIVMAMRYLKGDALDLSTFSYVASQAKLNEEKWIDQVGQAVGSKMHKVQPLAHDLAKDLDGLIRAQGEPFRTTSMYAQYRVFQLAKSAGIKVMLDGQGADELLGGYRTYLGARLASLLAQGQYDKALTFVRRTSATLPDVNWAFLLARAGGLLLPEKLQEWTRILVGQQRFLPWLSAEWIKQHVLKPLPLRMNQQASVLQEQLYRATTQVSIPQLLRYADRNSMAHSIESRVPFLTPTFASFVLALPESYLIAPSGTSKHVFRAAMRGVVPDSVLDRQDKIGFTTPEYRWLVEQRAWYEQVLHSDRAHTIPAFNLPVIHREFESIANGRQRFDFKVWRWVNLIRWAECFDVVF